VCRASYPIWAWTQSPGRSRYSAVCRSFESALPGDETMLGASETPTAWLILGLNVGVSMPSKVDWRTVPIGFKSLSWLLIWVRSSNRSARTSEWGVILLVSCTNTSRL
jgi:hypothetical protein